jgi:(1->4)-alpha-D-glucan 1-alpha-D-glucosylmutase
MTATPAASTYRVQLHAGFGFADARAVVGYLHELGVGALYASPFFAARPGSTHGYDVVDYAALNPEVGDRAGFDALADALREAGLGLLADFVPNHMGIAGGANRWWQDVLENGRTSAFAPFFDIAWDPPKRELRGKVLLPILGDAYGLVLERGELPLRFDGGAGAFAVDYYETPLPLAPPTYPAILRRALPTLEGQFAADAPMLLEFLSVVTAFERLAPQDADDPEAVAERRREQVVAKRRLADLTASEFAVAEAIADAVEGLNGAPGDPRSFDDLDTLLGEQSWRLSSFRTAAEEINYRRFFAINDLAGLRQEEPAVFAASHGLLLELIASRQVTGVRIDHPDGLWDPAGYVAALQAAAGRALRGEEPFAAAPAGAESGAGAAAPVAAGSADDPDERPTAETGKNAPAGANPAGADTADGADARVGAVDLEAPLPLWLVVEKILEPGEELPTDWAVHGTVGYEFARLATGVLVDQAGRKPFADLYARFTGQVEPFPDLVHDEKLRMLRTAFASELNVLASTLNRISEHDRRTRDFTFNTLRDALRETIACFPIYRTYMVCPGVSVAETDRRAVEAAIVQARRRAPGIDPSVFAFLRTTLLRHDPAEAPEASEAQRAERCRFAMKVQQLTGPVMAKGLEDTAFYVDVRLAALNEVGGDPMRFGASVDEFHRANAERLARWPHGLLASSTHDTKRSEDVRARLAVLSERPGRWRAAIVRWARFNRRLRTRLEGEPAPGRNDEYLFYQAILGAWPPGMAEADAAFVERIAATMLKSAREAGVHTAWIGGNEAYEAALDRFVRTALDPARSDLFLADFARFREAVAALGAANGLSMQALKLAAPGVPDIYQGTELWDFSLVDPDNRRPVDYAARREALRDLLAHGEPDPAFAASLLASWEDGRAKLWLTHRMLTLRRDHPALFAHGAYLPLAASGDRADHALAFGRRRGDAAVLIIAPRLVAGLTFGEARFPCGADWGDGRLPLPNDLAGRRWRNLLTGEDLVAEDGALPLARALATWPVGVFGAEST